MKKLSVILALLLAACGSSNDGSSLPPLPDQVPPAADAFFAEVQMLVAALPDDAEPLGIDNLAATAPDNSESAAL